jgi:hypothetical protein
MPTRSNLSISSWSRRSRSAPRPPWAGSRPTSSGCGCRSRRRWWRPALICGALGGLIGVTGLKRLRADYQAMVTLVISILATTVAGADTGLFNGDAGLSLIPNPLASVDPARRGWYYVAAVAVACGLGYLALRRFTTGPLGRALRAVREDEDTAAAAGKNVVGLRLMVQAVGGIYAGISGAVGRPNRPGRLPACVYRAVPRPRGRSRRRSRPSGWSASPPPRSSGLSRGSFSCARAGSTRPRQPLAL